MLEALLLITLGIVGLFFGGETLVKGASRLAFRFGVSPLVIGLTVVAFGTSMPELVVSLNAAAQGSSEISIGNVVGSNIFNIGFILGVTGLITPIIVHISLLRREIPIMIAVSVLTILLASDGQLNMLDGILLLAGIIIFTVGLIWDSRREKMTKADSEELEELEGVQGTINLSVELLRVIGGIILLVIGARLTVDGAVIFARSVGISELVIGLTLVAGGTSLPELATSLIAALRKQNDISVGNVVGSNIFNLLCILGLTGIVRPITIAPSVLQFDVWVMLAFAILLLPFAWRRTLGRRAAAAFLVGFLAYTAWTVLNNAG